MTSTRQDKEKLVLDLYYNQNKSYHQIAREARICPRDIKTILNKVIKGKESQEMIDSSAAIASNMMFIGSRDGLLYVFGSETTPPYIG
jgi:hypothetical protein